MEGVSYGGGSVRCNQSWESEMLAGNKIVTYCINHISRQSIVYQCNDGLNMDSHDVRQGLYSCLIHVHVCPSIDIFPL